MASEALPPAFDRARTVFRSLLLQMAAQGEDRFSARTVIALQSRGLMRKAKPSPLSPETLAVITQSHHSARAAAPAGPYVFVNQTTTSRSVLDMSEYLLSPNPEARRAALDHFRGIAARDALAVQTLDLLSSHAEILVSGAAASWERVAVELYDAVRDDYLCALAGFRQSLELGFDAGVDIQLPRVLRPSAESLQLLMKELADPIRQREQVERAVQELGGDGRGLTAIADEYFAGFGHLPLSGALSMEAAVGPTLRQSNSSDAHWDELWAWANRRASPLCRYHVCQVYCANPQFVPARRLGELWDEVAAIVDVTSEIVSGPWAEAWRVRCDLARHFNHYLAYRLPGQDGDAVGVASWWLAERVAGVLGNVPEYLRAVREGSLAQEVELSSYAWQLVHPASRPSRLRYATALVRSAWSLSIQCQLEPLIRYSGNDMLAPPTHAKVLAGLHGSVLGMFPRRAVQSGTDVYAFDGGITPTAEAWLARGGPSEARELLEALLQVAQRLRDTENLADQLATSVDSGEAEQFLVAGALRGWVYLHEGDFDRLWETVSSSEWGDRVLLKIAPRAMELVFEALNEARSRGGEKWNAYVPHLFASYAARVSGEAEREALLFAFTIISSLSANSLSAIDRLLRSAGKTAYKELVVHWRRTLTEAQSVLPSWIAGRFAGALLALRSASAGG